MFLPAVFKRNSLAIATDILYAARATCHVFPRLFGYEFIIRYTSTVRVRIIYI